uniref:RING-type domain-containing protein n=2 Tax=Lepisosteus oculatus TaxID=7918 RepID=W5NLC6_LEPOC
STDECPICTELYESQGDRLRALLHCHHTVCQRCLAALQQRATDRSRVCCPLCRQKTPLPQWEIRSMQEELMSHMGTSSPSTPQPTP